MELLAPARDLDSLKAAFDAGADAVYLGLKNFSARKRTTNFTFEELYQANNIKNDKKIYVTVNTLVFEKEIPQLLEILCFLEEIKIDAIIIQDYGVYKIIKDLGLNLTLFASTQMGTKNYFQANFLENLGFKRIILERQLTLKEIESIKNKTKVELEVFIHGANCFSLSGCCFFSQYLTRRSGNRGECAQPCRWVYSDDKCDCYPFSMKDLQGLDYISELKRIGVESLKIEGRMKGVDYVYNVVSSYRKALDLKGHLDKKTIENLKQDIYYTTLSRKNGSGFFIMPKNTNELIESDSGTTGIYIGKISSAFNKSIFFNTLSNFNIGDTLRIHDLKTDKRYKLPVKAIYFNNEKVRSAAKNSYVGIPSNLGKIPAGSKIYLAYRREAYKPKKLKKMPFIEEKFNYKEKATVYYEKYIEIYCIAKQSKTEIVTIEFNPDKNFYKIDGKDIYFIAPDIYESNSSFYKSIEADGYFISHPVEAQLFRGKKIIGSFYLYATNLAAISFFSQSGIDSFSESIDIDRENQIKIKNHATIWIIWKKVPLWISRVCKNKKIYTLKTDKKIIIHTNKKWGIKAGLKNSL